MTYKELLEKYNLLLDMVSRKQLKDAFDLLEELSRHCRNSDLMIQLENYYQIYINLLKYSLVLSNDPEKEKVYGRLRKSLIELVDDIREDIIVNYGLLNYYTIKREVDKQVKIVNGQTDEFVDSLEFEHEIEQILNLVTGQPKSTAHNSETYRTSLLNVFKLIWLTDKFKDVEIEVVNKIIQSKSIAWYDKSILVSALTLSVFRHFDSHKIMLLFDFYEAGEHQLWQRALIGLVLALKFYDKRLIYYTEITDRLKAMQGNKDIVNYLEMIIIQFIKAKETEKITKKIQDEILPEVFKIKSKFEEKLGMENLFSEKTFEEKNPEWENFFKDSPDVYKKFEDFSNMQLEGADVFLSAFSLLKRFDFFNEISNWFLPFYKENETVTDSLQTISDELDIKQFAEGLERSAFMCNSDKYSFCLNVKYLPAAQKSMMTELFNMELQAMNEMAEEDSMTDTMAKNKSVFTQYFQDLYRFHKLHPLKDEFQDIFEIPYDLYDAKFFRILADDKKMIRNVGEFFFEKNYYKEALDLFLDCSFKNDSPELFEKIAFCYQQTGNLSKALEFYHKAEIMERNRVWIYNKIAFCYRKNREFDKAISYYQSAEKLEPENLQIQTTLGQTFMEMEDYDNALKYFFKVEYLAPDDHKIQRPIAWCSFIIGKLDNALKYLKKIIARDPNMHDFLNLGHIEWCLGNRQNAIENYRTALKKSKNDFDWLVRVFNEDKKFLLKNGVYEFDIPLMIDYLKISP